VQGHRKRKSKQANVSLPPNTPHHAPSSVRVPSPRIEDEFIDDADADADADAEIESFEDTIMGWTSELRNHKNQDMTMMSLNGASDFFADFQDLEEPAVGGSSEASASGFSLPLSIPGEDMMAASLDSNVETLTSGSSIDTNAHAAFHIQRPVVNVFSSYSNAPTPPPAPAPPPPSRPSGPSREVESQSVLACTQLISSLENYIIADLKALDIILGIIKKAVDSLNQLISLQEPVCNFRCQMLFGVIMNQIITLLEVGCGSMVDGGKKGPPDSLSPLFGETPLNSLNSSYLNLPAFALGTFQLDAKEQRSWRAQIVSKELQQTSTILQRIMVLRIDGNSDSNEHASKNRTSPCLLSDVDYRLKALIEAVRKA
jgi:hypothetical protein